MKECFGSIFTDSICADYYNCKFINECLTEVNITHGECDCKYKASCHLSRQTYQTKFKSKDHTSEDCDFYQLAKKIYANKI